MAGAKPEHFPLILALGNDVPFGNSTTSMANMILVNGPIRNEMEMNYGLNVMGPHNEANSVMGRTYTLMSKTAGDLHAGKTTWSSLGSNIQYNNLCIAENEEALPAGWKPFHVQMGVKPTDSVTLGRDRMELYFERGRSAEGIRPVPDSRLHAIAVRNGRNRHHGPAVAALLKDSQGFNTKADLPSGLRRTLKKPLRLIGATALFRQCTRPWRSRDSNPTHLKEEVTPRHIHQAFPTGWSRCGGWRSNDLVCDGFSGRSGRADRQLEVVVRRIVVRWEKGPRICVGISGYSALRPFCFKHGYHLLFHADSGLIKWRIIPFRMTLF